jgi:zinc transport system substrate-binding protein
VVASLATTLVGCTRQGDRAADGKVSVVASFYPLAEAAQRVGGDQVAVTNLTPPGVEAHDLELRPQDVEAIATADVVLYLGGGFQPAVEDALGDAAGMSVDPHVWLDPVLYEGIVRTVERALIDVDPAGASTFRRNADGYLSELGGLDEAFKAGLADCERNVIVTSHAAFGYLAGRYGLTQEAITGLSPEAEPDAQRLAQLEAFVQREGVTTIFTEDQVSPAVAETLAGEAGVTTAVLHPLESLTADQEAAGADYGSLMRENLSALRSALGCA